MVTLLLKKSYRLKDLKEIKFNDLWNAHGVFTTMRIIGKPGNFLFFKEHINNLINSSKFYKIKKKNLKKNILNLIQHNLKKNIKYDHLFRIALNNKTISISLRKRLSPKNNFKLKMVNYKRIQAEYKNLKYKKILNILNKLDTSKFDIALHKSRKLLETGTSNLLFIKKKKIFSPKKDFYRGTTFKFFSQKININLTNVFIDDLIHYDEIIVVGSGKGVVSVASIEKNIWKRKSLNFYKKLVKIYNTELNKLVIRYD